MEVWPIITSPVDLTPGRAVTFPIQSTTTRVSQMDSAFPGSLEAYIEEPAPILNGMMLVVRRNAQLVS